MRVFEKLDRAFVFLGFLAGRVRGEDELAVGDALHDGRRDPAELPEFGQYPHVPPAVGRRVLLEKNCSFSVELDYNRKPTQHVHYLRPFHVEFGEERRAIDRDRHPLV